MLDAAPATPLTASPPFPVARSSLLVSVARPHPRLAGRPRRLDATPLPRVVVHPSPRRRRPTGATSSASCSPPRRRLAVAPQLWPPRAHLCTSTGPVRTSPSDPIIAPYGRRAPARASLARRRPRLIGPCATRALPRPVHPLDVACALKRARPHVLGRTLHRSPQPRRTRDIAADGHRRCGLLRPPPGPNCTTSGCGRATATRSCARLAEPLPDAPPPCLDVTVGYLRPTDVSD